MKWKLVDDHDPRLIDRIASRSITLAVRDAGGLFHLKSFAPVDEEENQTQNSDEVEDSKHDR